jgi:hypothetical protein
MDSIREVIVALFLATAYAGGPEWVKRASQSLEDSADDPEIGQEAAGVLRAINEHSRELFESLAHVDDDRDCVAFITYLGTAAVH